ncbi:MAG: hypothetical protein IKK03_00380 [Lachnospiraceae bacterium]|nr:hypothetical protein [Lachnospiraceae bacterium]
MIHKCRRNGLSGSLLMLLVVLLGCLMLGCSGEGKSGIVTDERSKGNDSVEDGTYLLTVDGYGVTEEEFLLFLRDMKAATANYYWVNYQLQPDKCFWDTEVDGRTPLEYAKERALDAVIRAKVEFILASEWGILEYTNYNSMMENMEEENIERSEKKEQGEVYYGISEYTPYTYYQYLNENIQSELEYYYEENSNPTEEQLRVVYDENLDKLTLGAVYHYTVVYEDGKTEEVSLDTNKIGKEDYTAEELASYYFPNMEQGDIISEYYYYNGLADITLNSVEERGEMSFEEAKDSCRVFWARSEVSRLIKERSESAEIAVDEARYATLSMP